MARLVAALLLLAGCQETKEFGGDVGGTAAEYTICLTGLVNCGQVYMCAALADNPLGHVEICVDDDADDGGEQLAAVESAYGDCVETPRHQGLCLVCPEGAGCNAYNGCWGCE